MKKLMFAALMLFSASVAFAGNSDALKAILKAKTYADAENLLKTNFSQLAGNSEKAAAYNKLVDLAMDKVNKEQVAITNNQMVAQLKQGKEQPVDTAGYNKAVYDAIYNALECEKYDILPNEKGKVKPRFHNNNQTRLYAIRTNLINSGQEAGKKNDKTTAFNHFALYVESGNNSLFKEVDRTKNPDVYMGEVARVAAVYAYQNKDMTNANKYVDVALQDTASYKDALDLKIYFASQGLKTKSDSLKFAETLEGLYQKDPKNDMVFGQLASVYSSLGEKQKSEDMINKRLAEDPNNYTALAMKGQSQMNAGKFDEAIDLFKKAIAVRDKEPLIYAYIGFCYNSKAAAQQNMAEQKRIFTESLPYLEKCRSLDPDRKQANWSYPLYQCYYILYGANDSRTKEVEALVK